MAEEEEKIIIGKRCYVGNLNWKTSWQDLKDKFRPCGNVVYANVMRTEDGRSKGWGIVEFETPEEAYKAVKELNGIDLKGRRLNVREDREDRDVRDFYQEANQASLNSDYNRGSSTNNTGSAIKMDDGSHRRHIVGNSGSGGGGGNEYQIVVQGLPYDFVDEDLYKMFEDKIGGVEEANVQIGKDGKSRGFGIVKFGDKGLARKAIDEFDGSRLDGRTLRVKFDRFV